MGECQIHVGRRAGHVCRRLLGRAILSRRRSGVVVAVPGYRESERRCAGEKRSRTEQRVSTRLGAGWRSLERRAGGTEEMDRKSLLSCSKLAAALSYSQGSVAPKAGARRSGAGKVTLHECLQRAPDRWTRQRRGKRLHTCGPAGKQKWGEQRTSEDERDAKCKNLGPLVTQRAWSESRVKPP